MANDAPTHTGPRKIVRRPDDGHIAGVCAGVADYFNVDPAIVRVVAVVLAFTGPGIPAYLLAWVFFPAADGSLLVDGFPRHKDDRRTQVIGIVLIGIALSVLWGDWWSPARGWMVPIGLIGVGAWLLLRRDRDDERPVGPTGTDPSRPGPSPWAWPTPPTSVVPAPPMPAGTTGGSATDTDAADATDVADASGAPVDSPETSVFAPGSMGWGPPPGGIGDDPTATMPDPPPPAHLPSGPRRRRIVGPLVFGALLLWGGIAGLAGIELQDGLAIGLCILGGGFVLGAFIGGSKALVFPALLVGAALVVTSMVDIPWEGGIGDKRWEVDRVSQLRDTYELGIGEATLDLRNLDLSASGGRTGRINVDVGIGHLVVLVPEDVALVIDGEVGMGEAKVLGQSDDGVNVDLHRTIDGDQGRGRLELDLHLGIGELEVVEAA